MYFKDNSIMGSAIAIHFFCFMTNIIKLTLINAIIVVNNDDAIVAFKYTLHLLKYRINE